MEQILLDASNNENKKKTGCHFFSLVHPVCSMRSDNTMDTAHNRLEKYWTFFVVVASSQKER